MVADVSRAAEIITTAEICSERQWNINYYPSLCLQRDHLGCSAAHDRLKRGSDTYHSVLEVIDALTR